MIKGVHAMFYSSRADQLRDFIKDKLLLLRRSRKDGRGAAVPRRGRR